MIEYPEELSLEEFRKWAKAAGHSHLIERYYANFLSLYILNCTQNKKVITILKKCDYLFNLQSVQPL